MNSDPTSLPLMQAYTAGTHWVWLDLDDTLIDFRANSLESLRLTYADCRLDRYFSSCGRWIKSYLHHNHDLWDRYNRAEITQDYLRMHRFLDPIRECVPDMSEEAFATEARNMDTIYLDHLARQKCMIDGAMELVRHLRAHAYNIGILSNGFSDVQHRKIHTVGLDTMIDLTVLSDDIGVNKPDPRLYRHAMERTGLTDPARHLMIGDNPATDIDGALHSGWRAIRLDPSSASLSLTPLGLVTPSLHALAPLFTGQDTPASPIKNTQTT